MVSLIASSSPSRLLGVGDLTILTPRGLAVALRSRDVQTFVSHSSLSLDERRRAEQAFAEARDCVIVSTSTLELGIDVGDVDLVVQVGATRSIATLLQRVGRSGR